MHAENNDATEAGITNEANAIARQIGAVAFIECSALTLANVREVFTCGIAYCSHAGGAVRHQKKSWLGRHLRRRSGQKSGEHFQTVLADDKPPVLPEAGKAPRLYVGECRLSENLLRLLREDMFQDKGDVIFCCSSDRPERGCNHIKAHSFVLRSCGSSKLQSLIPSSMLEKLNEDGLRGVGLIDRIEAVTPTMTHFYDDKVNKILV